MPGSDMFPASRAFFDKPNAEVRPTHRINNDGGSTQGDFHGATSDGDRGEKNVFSIVNRGWENYDRNLELSAKPVEANGNEYSKKSRQQPLGKS